MRLAIVTAVRNGVGLQRDFEILRRLTESAGHEITGVDHRGRKPKARFDLVLFVETYVAGWEDIAPVRWCCPNPEWWSAGWNAALPSFDRVLAKTRDAERIFAGLGARTVLVGFESPDRMDAAVPRDRRFLHIAGDSTLKGTAAVVEAWERHGIQHPLTIVARKLKLRPRSRAVTVRTRVPESELRALQNRCIFALQPSAYEGWGHVLHEALSVGAVLATTDAPPMGEVGAARLIPPSSHGEHGLARLALVDADGVARAVEALWSMTEAEVTEASRRTRAAYERETADFRAAFLNMLEMQVAGKLISTASASAKDAADLPEPSAPRVAIVFPCHASGAALVRRSVLALRWQTAAPDLFEAVIGADGGDPDGLLAEAATQAARTDLPGRPFACRVVDAPRPRGDTPHRNHARNAGWRAARAPLCWMLDADFILPPHAVEHLLAEHDACVAAGRPAVFSPCLAGVGAVGPEEWLARSAAWVESGRREDMEAALDCGGVAPCHGGYPERHTGASAPRSSPLADLPEGMPVVWRGLLDALGGFDEEVFGGWGDDKVVFIDMLKACASARLFEVRLLSSVQALHQPHHNADPDRPADWNNPPPTVRARWAERHRRLKIIRTMGAWWRQQLERARAAIGSAVGAATPGSLARAPNSSCPSLLTDAPSAQGRGASIADMVQQHAGRWLSRAGSPVIVLGAEAEGVVAAMIAAGFGAEAVDVEALAGMDTGYARGAVLSSVFATIPDAEAEQLAADVRRVVRRAAPIVLFEATRRGCKVVRPGVFLRPPQDYQRALPGLGLVARRDVGGSEVAILAGRLR